jgi:hypothetical protein
MKNKEKRIFLLVLIFKTVTFSYSQNNYYSLMAFEGKKVKQMTNYLLEKNIDTSTTNYTCYLGRDRRSISKIAFFAESKNETFLIIITFKCTKLRKENYRYCLQSTKVQRRKITKIQIELLE